MLEQSISIIQKLLLNAQTIWLIYITDYDPNKIYKTWIVFQDVFADKLSNKKLNPVVTGLFIWGGKLNISLHNLILLWEKILGKLYALIYYENF